jgi:membrane protein insertase Oxa1/YidC/SpoIIIJ
MNFLGLIQMGGKSIVLDVLAGVTQFIQGYLSSPITPKVEVLKTGEKTEHTGEDFATSMQTSMKYFLPFIITLAAWSISAAVALYFVTSNIFTIVQEWYIRRTINNNKN